jgi:hypothetical protein
MAEEIIAAGDLPAQLIEAIGTNIRPFTITFVQFDESRPEVTPSPLGSGVLVSAGRSKAILTANHVLKKLPRDRRLCVFLGKTNTPHTLDIRGLDFREIAQGKTEADGPDLAAIVMAHSITGAIESKKAFYNLDLRRDDVLHRPFDLNQGVWIAQGYLEERNVVTLDADGRGRTMGFYEFSGVGGPQSIHERDGFDYSDFPVSADSRASSPKSWGGMSGGGLWQVPLVRKDGDLEHRSPILSGVLFYQYETSDTQCGVKAHFRRSVYEVAYAAIAS